MKITFLGAAGTVTGSKYLIETTNKKILIDCGMFQGVKKLRLLNWEKLPVKESSIDVVLLTHGHMDHTGYLPRLVKAGFKGKIIGTAPTLEIAEVILKDSAKIQEEDAKRANKEKFSKHTPAKPLYGVKDVEKTLSHFHAEPRDKWIKLSANISFRFRYNGHILGATFIELNINGKMLVFSGDIGREKDVLMFPTERPERADILFIESTYGNRLHPEEDAKERLKKIVNETYEKGGTIIIPSFAVERTQLLMYLLWQLSESKEIPNLPMIMDSPMATKVLDIFHHHKEWHKLNIEDCKKMCKRFRVVENFGETWEVIDDKQSKIVIAGSGMVSGGRVLTYLQQYIDKPETTLLLTGYQAEGTRGRRLQEGTHEVKMRGKYYPVKAQVEMIHALSGHADQQELLNWMSAIKNKPEKIFIVHGEADAADAFRVKIKDTYGWDAAIPSLFEIQEIK